jgi:serine/threonine protein phosphatase 1
MKDNNNLIAIIGDIHGCYNTLVKLYEKITEFGIKDVYSVGDLVDRGKYSKEAVQFCIDKGIKPVKGNHEDMMVLAIDKPDRKEYLIYGYSNKEMYLFNGCNKTMLSYIKSEDEEDFDVFKKEIKKTGHFDFLKNMPMKLEVGSIVISHSGIVKGEPEVKWLWNRDIPSKLDKYQVFGHTSREECKIAEHYACIDTGCVYGRKLSAMIIDSETAKIDTIISEHLSISDEKHTLNYY